MKERKEYKRIKELREDNDLTQKDLGDILKISQRGYAHYECGDYDLTGELLIKLSNYYKVSSDYLLGLTDSPLINKK